MTLPSVDRDLINTEVYEHLCSALKYLSITAIRISDSPDYCVQDKDRLLDAIETVASITRDFLRINSSTLN